MRSQAWLDSVRFSGTVREVFAFLVLFVVVAEFRPWHDGAAGRHVSSGILGYAEDASTKGPQVCKLLQSIDFSEVTLV